MSKTKLIIATVALACLSTATWADGYEGSGGKSFAEPAEINWTGVYVGGHVGYGWADVDSDFDFGAANSFLFNAIGLQRSFGQDIEGWMGGVHLGVQHQHGNWVFGVEGTYDSGDLDESSNAGFEAAFALGNCPAGPALGGCVVGSQSLKTEIEDLWTLTGRVGYAWNRWLAYVKGGYARAEVKVQTNIDAGVFGCLGPCGSIAQLGFAGASSEDHHGWTVGGGAEYMVRKNITLGFEYNYISLESKTHTVDGTFGASFDDDDDGGFGFRASHGLEVDPDSIHAISARLTFLFGPQEHRVEPLK